MKKVFTALVLFILVLMAISTVTAAPKPATTTASASCDLSSLKVKDVKINGDKDEFVAIAIKSELFAHGAKNSSSGLLFVGKIELFDGLLGPMVNGLSVSSPGSNYASSVPGSAGLRFMEAQQASRYLAQKAVADFCKVPVPVAQARK